MPGRTPTIPTVTANTRARAGDVNNIATALKSGYTDALYDGTFGTIYLTATAKSGDYTILDNDGITTILMTTGASQASVTLPAAANNSGRIITLKKVDSGAGNCRFSPTSFEGATSHSLPYRYDAMTVQSDGTDWHIISRYRFNGTSAKSGDYTIGTHDGIETLLVTAASNVTVTLPTVGSAPNIGRKLTIKKVDSGGGKVTVDTPSTETIDGEASIDLLSQYDTITIISDGTNWHSLSVSQGGGAGEKNYIETGSNTAASWANVGDLDVATTTTAADLPREHTTRSGIKITADANTQSTADYVYYDFTLDDVDLNKKLKIKWDQKTTGTYAAGDLAVVITTQADRTTAVATPQTTAIPAADGTFYTSFDTSSTATLSLVIRATTDMTTDGGIVISDVVVGPGIQLQGAVSQYLGNLSFTAASAAFGTVVSPRFDAWRDGSVMKVKGRWVSGTVAAGTMSIALPSGYTIDSSALSSASNGIHVGDYVSGMAASNVIYNDSESGKIFYDGSDTANLYLAVRTGATASTFTKAAGTSLHTAGLISLNFEIPIAEWAGSGTVNLAQNDVEYAYNSSTTDADDTSSFAYGPGGGQFGAFTALRNKTVRFQTAIQATDEISMEVTVDGGVTWMPATQGTNDISSYMVQNGVSYGVRFYQSTSTDVIAVFGLYRRFTGTYGAAGTDYTAIDADNTYKWRIKKIKAGAAVGFGLATSASSGLITHEQSITHATTFTFNGSGGSSGSVSLLVRRVGKMVTVEFPSEVRATSGTTSTILTSNTALDTTFRPAQQLRFPCIVDSGGTTSTTPGYIRINTDGTIGISRDFSTTAWPNSTASCGSAVATAISYTIA